MGRIFYRQPNGLVTIFSTNCDCPVYWNLDKEKYINLRIEEAREQAEKETEEIFDMEDPPRYVKDIKELQEQIIYNCTKEEFEKYLKDIGYEGSINDFKYIMGVTWKPVEEE